jgi:thioredoxin reductase (NADPH)
VRETEFLKTYTEDVSLILTDGGTLDDEHRATLAEKRIGLVETSTSEIRLEEDRLTAGGHVFDTVYPALGMHPRTELAAAAGALTARDDRLWVNDHQMTSVPGLYAAGDMVRGLNQISIAQAEAAIAATDIHNRLRQMEDA